jgi:branched-chain amino acid transport system substrate-binding protein
VKFSEGSDALYNQLLYEEKRQDIFHPNPIRRDRAMKKRILYFVMGLVVLFTLLSDGQVGSAAETKTEITVGVSIALTGFAAAWGTPAYRALEILVDQINGNGGLIINEKKYLIKLITYDDKFDAREGAIIARRLLFDDKVDVFISYAGPSSTAATSISSKAEKFQYGTSYAETEPSPKAPLNFAMYIRYPECVPAGLRWLAKKHPEIKKLAIITPNNPDGFFTKKITNLMAPEVGIDIVAQEMFEPGTVDFTSTLLKVLKLKPDVLDLTNCPSDPSALITKQAKDLGFAGKLVHWTGPGLSVCVDIVSGAVMEGFIGGMEYGEPYSEEMTKKVIEPYLKKYGPPFSTWALPSYTGWQVLFQGIEQAQSWDSKVLANAMRKGKFKTISGPAFYGGKSWYGIDNQLLYPLWIATVKDGKVVQLDTAETGIYPKRKE